MSTAVYYTALPTISMLLKGRAFLLLVYYEAQQIGETKEFVSIILF